ncbi:MAG TPA: acetyl-CoA carboxylase biotin carboxylase subunit [Rhodopila sp.]|nr:acetyl-CoA carboxylase biotin carboxylase subunit [Rhodopila sp.]
MRRLFIANRGEIAVRIIRSAHALGIATVQAVSEADGDMLAARLAGATVVVGPARASKSYLNGAALVQAALESGCDAVHPGYGFLSENAEFAAAVEAAGLVFVGPSAQIIRRMGDKVEARLTAKAAGVPTVPGSDGRVTPETAHAVAEQIGLPLMIKASAGGGGRGIRIVERREELETQLAQASAEAKAAFGDGGLYLERFIRRARHVEVQIIGDGADVVHLYERECSIQRRRQKVWEEAPAVALKPEIRAALCESAVRLGRSVNYKGAGTLEYLYDEESERFFFIEMNTRIQVEHPVTEMITGLDVVQEMLRIAAGRRLSVRQDEVVARGHAIECRINAEDPRRQFAPNPGVVTEFHVPGGPGVRFDGAIYPGYRIPIFYDSLLGKLIVWGETREAALGRLRQALAEMQVSGVETTLPLHRSLVEDPEVLESAVHTNWLEAWLAAHFSPGHAGPTGGGQT